MNRNYNISKLLHKKTDPSWLEVGKKRAKEMLTEATNYGHIVDKGFLRKEITEDDVNDYLEGDAREITRSIIALILGVGFMFIHPVCGGVLIIAAIFSIVLTPFLAATRFKEITKLSKSGPIEAGYIGTLDPKSRLLLGFSWYGNKVHIETCRHIPKEHQLVLYEYTGVSGGEHASTYTATKISIKIPGNSKNILIRDRHGKLKAARVSLENSNWREILDGEIIEQYQ